MLCAYLLYSYVVLKPIPLGLQVGLMFLKLFEKVLNQNEVLFHLIQQFYNQFFDNHDV